LFHGKGTLSLPNGYIFEGEFENGFPKGHGTIKLPDGNILIGEIGENSFVEQTTEKPPVASNFEDEVKAVA